MMGEKTHFVIASAALALGLSACATTDTEVAAADPAPMEGVNAEGEEVRCRMIRETGTRFSRRVCLTTNDWEEVETATEEVTNDRDANPGAYVGNGFGGGPE